MRWHTIDTVPDSVAVDLWVRSACNENYSRRACNVCMVGGAWIGAGSPQPEYGEYATHWTPAPRGPDYDDASPVPPAAQTVAPAADSQQMMANPACLEIISGQFLEKLSSQEKP